MGLANYRLELTEHALQRYLQRVGPTIREILEDSITDQLQKQYRHKGDYLQTYDDTWWRIGVSDNTVTFYTCYGRHTYDLPTAIKWAKRYNDRIALGGLYGD